MPNIGLRRAPRGFTLIELLIVVAILAAMAGLVMPMIGGSDDQAKETISTASLTAVRDGFIGTGSTPGLYADLRYTTSLTTSLPFNPTVLRVGDLMIKDVSFPDYSPETRKGWRGPYVRGGFVQNTRPNMGSVFPNLGDRRFEGDSTFADRNFLAAYGVEGNPAVGDAWGNPIVLQIPSQDKFGNPFTTNEEAWKFARVVSAGRDGAVNTPTDALAGRTSNPNVINRGDDIILFLNRADVYE